MPIDDGATQAALDSIAVRIRKATRNGVDVGLDWVQTLARLNVTKRTGELATHIEKFGPYPGRIDGTWGGRVQPTVIYGRIHELGGRIYPHGKALAFFWPGHNVEPVLRDGRVLIRTYVYQRPQPYLKPAVIESKKLFQEAMKWEWRSALEYLK